MSAAARLSAGALQCRECLLRASRTDEALAVRKRRVATLALLATLTVGLSSSGCLVLALQPAYDSTSVTFDESLLGRWENKEDQTQLAIERGEWRSYKIVFTERGSSRALNGNLTSAGDAVYVDVTEMRGADPGPYLIPVHGIFRVAIDGDTLTVTPLDLDWFTRAVNEKRRGVPSLAIDDRRNVIIASPTAEIRRWLARPPAEAFGTSMTFTRISPVGLERAAEDLSHHRLR